MLITKYGLREVSICVILCGAAGAALWVLVTPRAVITPGVVCLFTLYFFRDPRRTPPHEGTDEGERVIVAPADGRVVDIEEVTISPDDMPEDEPDFLGTKALRVGVFLSLFDVHINRAPLAGRVRFLRYSPGRFLPAFNKDASTENESNLVGLETDLAGSDGRPLRLAVKQISGIIARRIVCVCKVAEHLARGERFGMIKFGSRTELYLPPGEVSLNVKVGDRVRAGLTVIGTVSSNGKATMAPGGCR